MKGNDGQETSAFQMRAAIAQRAIDQVASEGQRIETPVEGGAIVWHVWGEGPSLLLVHGGGGSWTHWIRNVDRLSRHFRLLVPDLPGCGQSRLRNSPDSAPEIATLLGRGVEQMLPPEQKFSISAFSFGSIVSAFLAMQMPERVSGLLMVGAVGLGVARNPRPALQRPAPSASLSERWTAARQNLEAMLIADPERIDDLAIHIHDRNTATTRLRTSAISRTDPLRGMIGRVPCPLMAAWGAADNLYGHDRSERIAVFEGAQNASRPQFIAASGHWVQYEEPGEIDRLTLSFLLPLLGTDKPVA